MAKESQQSPAPARREMDMQVGQAPIAPMVYTAGDPVGTKRMADGQVKDRSPISPVGEDTSIRGLPAWRREGAKSARYVVSEVMSVDDCGATRWV